MAGADEAGTDDAGGGRPPRQATELPTTFGKYYLTEKLATGGMAEIYLAKLIGPGGFEKQLVIKQIHPKLTGQRHFVDLFVAEAKTLVTLAHGNIVPVYELGVIDDTYFIAMDYIDGPTLYRLTETMSRRDALMEPQVAAWIAARVLDGLDYAHRKGEGVIHRDLSPRNVMMSRDGEVKLVDFGIAVTLGETGESHQSAPTGSFPYMSPEQVRRDALTGQTDLFSVGVLLWEMLVGRRLFARSDADATLAAVVGFAIPLPSSERPEVPAKLEEVVMRALERDREARWANAGDMVAALNRYLYALDEPPGAREIAALVAKFCPPATRRLPTHLEAIATDPSADARDPAAPEPADADGDASGPVTPSPPLPGPHTAVIPREGNAPRGKKQRRAQTFATHVELASMLERATPAEGDGEVDETNGANIETSPTAAPRTPDRPPTVEVAEDLEEPEPRPGIIAPKFNFGVPGRRAPSRFVLGIAAIGMAVLGTIALFVVLRARSQFARNGLADAPRADVAAIVPPLFDAAIDAPPAIDAGEPDAEPPPVDAAVLVHRDAAVRLRPDADVVQPPSRVDAAVIAPAGTATLKLGAKPWAEVYIDGAKQGAQAPNDFRVPVGHHSIRLVFPAVDPPREQKFEVDVKAGETMPLAADFTQ